MDVCIVCLQTSSDMCSRMSSITSEWQESNIQFIITKYLWWWYLKPTFSDHQWICRQCYQELLSFHIFHNRVQEAHRHYEQITSAKRLVAKQERQIFNDLVPLAFYKRKRKQSDLKISRNIETKVKSAVSIQDSENLKTEPTKEQTSETLKFITKNINWGKNNNHNNEEADCGRDMELIVVKEEFQISESSLTAIDEDLTPLEPSKTREKEKSSNATKDPETSNLKDKLEDSENKVQNKSLNENVKKCIKKESKGLERNAERKPSIQSQIKLEKQRTNNEYIKQSGYKFVCHLCRMTLTDFLGLKTHYRLEHKTVGYAKCCNKNFYTRETLSDHLRVHENPNYFKCPSCDKILSNRSSFETHLANHKLSAGERKPMFKCDKCDKLFLKKAFYTRHISLHIPDEERKFQCDECSKKFGSESLLKTHKDFAHLKKYSKICEICGKSFREHFYFKRHMDQHNGKTTMKVPCDICGVELTNKYLLNRHKKYMHTEENQQELTCPYCSKISPNLLSHRYHVFYNHKMERKHACHICDKKFNRALKLKEHISTHTREPLFTCSYCPQTFISKSNMYKHRKNDHFKEWLEAKEKNLTLPVKEYFDTNVSESNSSNKA